MVKQKKTQVVLVVVVVVVWYYFSQLIKMKVVHRLLFTLKADQRIEER